MTEEVVELPKQEVDRTKAYTLFVYGYSPRKIAAKLSLTTQQVRRWAQVGRWDQVRQKLKLEAEKVILAKQREQFGDVVTGQFSQINFMETKLFNNIRGLNMQNQPILDDGGLPVGELHVHSAEAALSLWIQVERLKKDYLFQLMPSISESLPLLDPSHIRLVRTGGNTGGTPQPGPAETPNLNEERARRRAEGKQRTPAADKVLGKVLDFERK